MAAHSTSSDVIVPFFLNRVPDNLGRYFRDILAWPDERLEYTHTYIQWLFPMRVPSPVNLDAPTVSDATVEAFRADPALRAALADAFARMAAFYGFDIRGDGGAISLVRAANFAERAANWLTSGNHNMLRITRIVTCLRLLGLDGQAQAFFVALDAVYATPEGRVIGGRTYAFWKLAAGR